MRRVAAVPIARRDRPRHGSVTDVLTGIERRSESRTNSRPRGSRHRQRACGPLCVEMVVGGGPCAGPYRQLSRAVRHVYVGDARLKVGSRCLNPQTRGSSAHWSPIRVRFDAFELDEANARLLSSGAPVPLAPTPFGVLCALTRQPGAAAFTNKRAARSSVGAPIRHTKSN